MNHGLISTGKLVHIVLLILALPLAGCQTTPPVVKIGLVAPFEGQYRSVGYDTIYSARLGVREVNKAGGIGAYRLALVALDDGGSPELSKAVATSLVEDPDVVAVIGHWLPETTAKAQMVYQPAGLTMVPGGFPPFSMFPAEKLPNDFFTDYEVVTPFDESAGHYAGPAYDAFYLVVEAMRNTVEDGRPINRQTMAQYIKDLKFEGITGEVYLP